MNPKTLKTIFSKIAKDKTNLKKHKVDLSLLDGLEYFEDIQYLEDEISRISYSTEEWYDENFEKFLEVRGQLRDVYINNSEAFISLDDLQNDIEILEDIKANAENLGISLDDLPIDVPRIEQLIKDLEYYEKRFDDQVLELKTFGV
jgi:hypothetical protein